MNQRLYAAALAGVVLLLLVTVLSVPASADIPTLSVRSSEADGSMALDHWLEASGYTVRQVTSFAAQIEDVDVLFILNPILDYSEPNAALLRDWLRRGKTLIIAASPFSASTLLDTFDVELAYLLTAHAQLSPAAPTLGDPPFDSARVEAVYAITTERPDAVPHLFSDGQPVLVSLREGRGTLWVSGALRPFTNLGLSDPGNARLIANLVASVPRQAVIGFDEAVHGFGEDGQQTLSAWFFGTAPGWGILVGFALTMVYMGLRGRRFGRALPLAEQGARRDMSEYIGAIATLFRRTGQRGEIVGHYDQQFRRRLSERYAVDPRLDAMALARAVAEREPTLDRVGLEALLSRLAQKKVNETELVAIATDVDRWLRSIP